jgi:hypothetical protein
MIRATDISTEKVSEHLLANLAGESKARDFTAFREMQMC